MTAESFPNAAINGTRGQSDTGSHLHQHAAERNGQTAFAGSFSGWRRPNRLR